MHDIVSIPFKRLKAGAFTPEYKHKGDAAVDLRIFEGVTIHPRELKLIKVGFALDLPIGYCAKIIGRSGLTLKGFIVLHGLIDETYRGEIGILCFNKHGVPFSFGAGARIAQMLVEQTNIAAFHEVDELTATERGNNGFGSSGI